MVDVAHGLRRGERGEIRRTLATAVGEHARRDPAQHDGADEHRDQDPEQQEQRLAALTASVGRRAHRPSPRSASPSGRRTVGGTQAPEATTARASGDGST